MSRIFLILLLLPLSMAAQKITVKGTVYGNEPKETLFGVSVLVKGTTIGTYTDLEGKFELQIDRGQTLVFSFLGMKTREIVVESSSIDITLESDLSQLDEVTISVGYFDINKKDLSGAITQVTSEQLEKNRVNSVEQLLQGQVAGVIIGESSEPGGGFSVSIRGTNSILGGTQPLYVIDGVPLDPLTDAQGNDASGQSQSSLSFLNPNDIEKIEVLKDAAATAVYGARGANGVVLVTTKSGDNLNGKDALSITVDNFLTDVIGNIGVMNGPQFESYMNQRAINQLYVNITNPARVGGAFDGTQVLDEANYPELAGFELRFPTSTGISSNWQDLAYRLAYSSAYNLSYQGGDKQKSIAMNLGLIENNGVITNSFNRRLTFNVNARTKAFKNKIEIASRSNIAYNTGNASSVGNGQIFLQRSVVSQTLLFQPIFRLLDPGEDDDIYADLNEGNIISNPFTLANDVIDKKTSYNFIQNLALTAKLTPKLTAIFRGAFNFQRSLRDNYYPSTTTRGRRNNGEASQSNFENQKLYGEANLRYINKFGKHRIDAIVVGTVEQNNIRSIFNKAFGFGSDATSFYNFTSATDVLVPRTEFREFGLVSGLSRVGYSFDRRYFVDVNARIDASSKFAENNKSAFFPSLALAWDITSEKFFSEVEKINNLKLRLSYGKTGSNPIQPYESLALMAPVRYNFNNQLVTGFFESNLANDDLTWETTDQFNAGLDISLFDSKINITLDAYYKLTYDLLQRVNLPPSNGFASRIDNFGEVENKGIELAINAVAYDSKQFKWNVSGNFFINRNKLLSLNSNLDFQLGPTIGFAQSNPVVFQTGSPLGIFWGAQTNGIYRDWEEANNSGIAGARPGEIRYVNNSVDLDENGVPLPTQRIDFADFVQIGDPNPDFNFAITNNFTFGKWDLNVLLTGQKGGDIFWVDSWQLAQNQGTSNGLFSAFQDSWRAPLSVTPDGGLIFDPSAGNQDNVGNPAAITNEGPRALASDRQIFDGSFVRLKNVNLGYTFTIKKKHNLRVFATGQNLLTWTKYPGYDPEVTTFNRDPQRRGVDFGGYPGTRNYTIGLRFNY